MKRAFRALVATTTALAVTAAPAAATTAAPDEADRAELRERLDGVVAAGAVGALAEVRDEHGVWRATSGTAERDKPRTVPVNGRFRVGSITKTFVATVTLQLVDEGRLRLDDTVQTWLPGAVPDGDRISVRQLLDHTSGLYDYQDTLPMPPESDFILDNRWRTWDPTELVERGVAHPPAFEPPGSDFSYSSTGYLLLGQIIEAVTGRTYGEQIERRIIRPLRLHGTSVPGTFPRIRGPHPHGYLPVLRDGEFDLVDFTEMNPSLFGAGGEMISTTRDLNRFVDALLGGRLLPDHLLDEMRTPGIEGGTYGLGLAWQDTSCGVRVYGNDGDALGYQSWSYSTPDRRRQVTIALTPDFSGETDAAVDAFLDEAFCG
ncbi:D-alanyl-D-alanine carboxypeptidase [Haloactinopolyspora alba]|uniref:D-alanyl-D-alanine carboxypeptidase n=1 Tax=Haloactinopolyspora alba TaxID=648780 RepID=A0A2P8E571_9ACTN|nr:serine hydrolase domain-containing protein [Haloactinopolyspora alba]PSL04611.1 D-alanyl-D-alanine carboxypeptidase [Haloactinopolyspora alba]